ncbi:MAG: hypothetical protein WC856_07730 [Methylococcaceae bacterium]|jgi:hypothetical protein
MTFLELCKEVRSRAGITGTGPLTVVGQIGELGRIVSFTNEAYIELQDSREDWYFLRNDFTFNCTSTVSAYPTTTVSNLANWKNDSFRCYLTTANDEQWLRYIPWDEFRDLRLFGTNRTATGKPIEFTIKPDKSLVLWPIPDAAYTVVGEYYRTAATMTADSDTPLFSRYQYVIVYAALMRQGAYISDPALYSSSEIEYNKLLSQLTRNEKDTITIGRAMA